MKKAYEFEGVAIGFFCPPALGDSIIAKKVFETLIQIEPNCKIDIFYFNEKAKLYAKAFYGGNKNLNLILDVNKFSGTDIKKYDLVLNASSHSVTLNFLDEKRIYQKSPELFQSILKIDEYNKKFIYNKDLEGVVLFQMARSRILKTNRYTCLACGGALPIYDNKVTINLLPEWQGEFDKLGLKKYITVGSNGGNFARHLVKEWPTRYWVEFISLMKSKMPDIQVVQSGGGGGTA